MGAAAIGAAGRPGMKMVPAAQTHRRSENKSSIWQSPDREIQAGAGERAAAPTVPKVQALPILASARRCGLNGARRNPLRERAPRVDPAHLLRCARTRPERSRRWRPRRISWSNISVQSNGAVRGDVPKKLRLTHSTARQSPLQQKRFNELAISYGLRKAAQARR